MINILSNPRQRNWPLKKPRWLDHQMVVALIFALKAYALGRVFVRRSNL